MASLADVLARRIGWAAIGLKACLVARRRATLSDIKDIVVRRMWRRMRMQRRCCGRRGRCDYNDNMSELGPGDWGNRCEETRRAGGSINVFGSGLASSGRYGIHLGDQAHPNGHSGRWYSRGGPSFAVDKVNAGVMSVMLFGTIAAFEPSPSKSSRFDSKTSPVPVEPNHCE